jgi:lysophospholipid hydrolase
VNNDGVVVIITGRVKIEEGRRHAPSLNSSVSQRSLQTREQSVSSWFCEPPLTRSHSRSVGYASRKSVLGVRSYSKSLFSSNSTHASSAVCARDSEFVRISPATVRVCTRLVPDFPWRLLNNNNNSIEQQLVTIAAIPLNKSSFALSQRLIQELAIALSPSVKVITEADLERRFGKDALDNLHLPFFREEVVQFLNHAEEQYKLVILFANTVDSTWASIACSSADMTLLLAAFHSPTASVDEVDAESAVSDGEQKLVNEANHGRFELVLLHTSESPPRNTRKWLISREWLFAHHHIRMSGSHQETNDIYRLSRRIAGLSIGLVLSGGGGKGLAHYGLFQAIEHNKLPVDFVGGTSQGAFMGALYCITESSEKMRPFVLRLSAYIGSTLGLVSDITFPFSAFFAGKEFSLAIRDALGKDTYIEDLWLPFYCVSTNLSS